MLCDDNMYERHLCIDPTHQISYIAPINITVTDLNNLADLIFLKKVRVIELKGGYASEIKNYYDNI